MVRPLTRPLQNYNFVYFTLFKGGNALALLIVVQLPLQSMNCFVTSTPSVPPFPNLRSTEYSSERFRDHQGFYWQMWEIMFLFLSNILSCSSFIGDHFWCLSHHGIINVEWSLPFSRCSPVSWVLTALFEEFWKDALQVLSSTLTSVTSSLVSQELYGFGSYSILRCF